MKCFIAVILLIATVSAVPVEEVSSPIIPLRDAQRSNRIINGSPATSGQFPYQVAIYIDNKSFCGGALISSKWVLTAAHCAKGGKSFNVYLGTISLNKPQTTRTVSRAIVHSGYSPSTLVNDVAVLELSSAVSFSSTIKSIPLSSSSLGSSVSVKVSGWGKTSDASSSVSQNLNHVSLSTISNSDCAKTYGSLIQSSTVCCGAGKNPVKSTCNGDSGGPLVTGSGSNAVHVGVVSFVSSAGCESGHPSGYARTASFRNWIKQQTGV